MKRMGILAKSHRFCSRARTCGAFLYRNSAEVPIPDKLPLHLILALYDNMVNFYQLKAAMPNGNFYNFDQLKNKVVLIVNTASKYVFVH